MGRRNGMQVRYLVAWNDHYRDSSQQRFRAVKKNAVKLALREGRTVWGTWVTIPDDRVVRILAEIGFDWVTVDMEHTALDWSQVDRLVGWAIDAGTTPLVRVPAGDPVYIKRALDLGAFGLVIPMVESAEQARQIIAASQYPPQGSRSAAAANHYRRFQTTLEKYLAAANEEIMIVLQIESPAGIEEASNIAGIPGCDALLIGPLDLACRLCKPPQRLPQASKEDFEAAVEKVIKAGRQRHCPTGFHARTVDEAQHWAARGMQLLAVSNDLTFLATQAGDVLHRLKSGIGRG